MMLKVLMISLMLSVTFSCSSYIVKDPQPVYVMDNETGNIVYGKKNFDYRKGVDSMGAWTDGPMLIQWSEIPKLLIAFPLDIWLTEILPALKSMARKHRDDND